MRRNSRFNNSRDPMDWIFKIFPYVFAGIFVLVLTITIAQFAVVGYVGYQVISDPDAAATAIGNTLGEIVRPVADAVRGE
jgi:hypothetical protein